MCTCVSKSFLFIVADWIDDGNTVMVQISRNIHRASHKYARILFTSLRNKKEYKMNARIILIQDQIQDSD